MSLNVSATPLRRLLQAVALGIFGWLFFHVAWPHAAVFSPDLLADKEHLPAELLLWLDPLVGPSTAIAARTWNAAVAARTWNAAVWGALAVAALCVAFPRAFCSSICPLGTLIDVFDRLVGRHVRRLHLRRGWWVRARFWVLGAVVGAAVFGVVLAGYVTPIPVLTRGIYFTAGRLQLGLAKSWSQVPHAGPAVYVSVALFALVFLLGLLGPRFWCRHLCPSGALLSLLSRIRLAERRVSDACTQCGRCAAACTFGAVAEDFGTRHAECTFCQACAGACPVDAIDFNWRRRDPAPAGAGPALSRRGLLCSAVGGAAAGAMMRFGRPEGAAPLLRPPGSLPEREFLALCVRCGECFRVCPGPVLHSAGLQGGVESLWTPVAVPASAGCHQDCNFCTQVCPTGAIRPLALPEKRRTRMGLAAVNTVTCLAHAGERECRLCFEECRAAGYDAIEMREVRLELGDVPEGVFSEMELEAMGRIQAPFVVREACVGCGLCEYRCHAAYVKQEHVLDTAAVTVSPEGAGTVV